MPKRMLKPAISRRYLAVLLGCVVFASLVGGRERVAADDASPVAEAITPTAPMGRDDVPSASDAADDLDLRLLNRRKRASHEDLFAMQLPAIVPPPVARPPAPRKAAPTPGSANTGSVASDTQPSAQPVAPPTPVAPPLPFRYLGVMSPNGKPLIILGRGEEVLMASAGQHLDGQYRVERISDAAVEIIFVPLNATQRLAIPALP
jgi:hypothetical protein